MHKATRREFALYVASAVALRGQTNQDLAGLSLTEASARVRARSVTPTQLTEACLARIEVYNPKLNAFITVIRDQALAQARELDAEQRAGKLRARLKSFVMLPGGVP
jgi:aspartyl-tRNA(Asn)/glutamyl-tRNA(Gln) amidotransferase subunit A